MPACRGCGHMFGPDWGSGLCGECRERLDQARTGRGWTDRNVDARGTRYGPVAWGGLHCVKGAIATVLGVRDIQSIPDPTENFFDDGAYWLGAYNERLKADCGVRLEELPKSLCPPKGHGLWIAAIQLEDQAHAVVCRGFNIYHDPSNYVSGEINMAKLIEGFQLIRTHRAVPNLSPVWGSQRMVVRS